VRSRANDLFLRAHLRFGLRHLRFEATGIETRQYLPFGYMGAFVDQQFGDGSLALNGNST